MSQTEEASPHVLSKWAESLVFLRNILRASGERFSPEFFADLKAISLHLSDEASLLTNLDLELANQRARLEIEGDGWVTVYDSLTPEEGKGVLRCQCGGTCWCLNQSRFYSQWYCQSCGTEVGPEIIPRDLAYLWQGQILGYIGKDRETVVQRFFRVEDDGEISASEPEKVQSKEKDSSAVAVDDTEGLAGRTSGEDK
jgi:hypothetical protein